MSVESAAPENARTVYNLLIALGAASLLIASIMIGIITYNYVTRIELREPVEELQRPLHGATLPDPVLIL